MSFMGNINRAGLKDCWDDNASSTKKERGILVDG